MFEVDCAKIGKVDIGFNHFTKRFEIVLNFIADEWFTEETIEFSGNALKLIIQICNVDYLSEVERREVQVLYKNNKIVGIGNCGYYYYFPKKKYLSYDEIVKKY